ncbi:hypothetical protein [Natrinema salinisoli]
MVYQVTFALELTFLVLKQLFMLFPIGDITNDTNSPFERSVFDE